MEDNFNGIGWVQHVDRLDAFTDDVP